MFALLWLLAAWPARAALSDVVTTPGVEIQVIVENDVLAGTDRFYSNGIKIGGGIPFTLLQEPAQQWLRQMVGDVGDTHFGLFLGQNLYTPNDIRVRAAQPLDRPWAAWLYLGGVAQRLHGERLDTVEFDVGVVGPAALGEPIQRGWHQVIGSPRPRGWENQIANEPAFQLAWLGKQRLSVAGIELIPHLGLTLGTVSTLARAGGIVRFGKNMTGFGPDTIDPGGALLQNMRRASDPLRAPVEWYGFVGVDHRYVAYNLFLDGGVLRDGGPRVDRRVHVYDLSAGVSLRWHALRVSLQRVRRSPEFVSATSNDAQTFDSLNIGVEF